MSFITYNGYYPSTFVELLEGFLDVLSNTRLVGQQKLFIIGGHYLFEIITIDESLQAI